MSGKRKERDLVGVLNATTRRSFMGSILALSAAPSIVRADSLMRIVPRETLVAVGCGHRREPGPYCGDYISDVDDKFFVIRIRGSDGIVREARMPLI